MTRRVAIVLLVFLGSNGPLAAALCVLEPKTPVQASSCSVEGNAGDYIRVVVEPNFVKLRAKLKGRQDNIDRLMFEHFLTEPTTDQVTKKSHQKLTLVNQ